MNDLPALAHPTGEHLDSAPVATLPVDTPSRFAELVCADLDLLRAEFEALIAANYPSGDGHPCSFPPRRKRPPPDRPGAACATGNLLVAATVPAGIW